MHATKARPPRRYDQLVKTVDAHKFHSAYDYYRAQYFAFVDGVIAHVRRTIWSAWYSLMIWDERCVRWVQDSSRLELQLRVSRTCVPAVRVLGIQRYCIPRTFQKPSGYFLGKLRNYYTAVSSCTLRLNVVNSAVFVVWRHIYTQYHFPTAAESLMLAVMHVHKDRVDNLDIQMIKDSFVNKSDTDIRLKSLDTVVRGRTVSNFRMVYITCRCSLVCVRCQVRVLGFGTGMPQSPKLGQLSKYLTL